jgi:adenylyltransferase/sulfurtransferase
MIYNGVANQFYRTAFQRRDDCLSHETYPAPHELPFSARQHSAADVLNAARSRAGNDGPLRLLLDRDLVVTIDCAGCNSSRLVMKPLHAVGMEAAHCPQCGIVAKPQMRHAIEYDCELAGRTLSSVGVPPYDMVRVETPRGEQVFLLGADRPGESS